MELGPDITTGKCWLPLIGFAGQGMCPEEEPALLGCSTPVLCVFAQLTSEQQTSDEIDLWKTVWEGDGKLGTKTGKPALVTEVLIPCG